MFEHQKKEEISVQIVYQSDDYSTSISNCLFQHTVCVSLICVNQDQNQRKKIDFWFDFFSLFTYYVLVSYKFKWIDKLHDDGDHHLLHEWTVYFFSFSKHFPNKTTISTSVCQPPVCFALYMDSFPLLYFCIPLKCDIKINRSIDRSIDWW